MSHTLVVVRHAQAAWPDDVEDHERPLTAQGRRDAAEAGRWLSGREGGLTEVALVSSARRTLETYEHLAGAMAHPPTLVSESAAYAASSGQLLQLIQAQPEEVSSLMLIGHNPGIGHLASLLDDGSTDIDRSALTGFPTASVVIFAFAYGWSSIAPQTGRLIKYTIARG